MNQYPIADVYCRRILFAVILLAFSPLTAEADVVNVTDTYAANHDGKIPIGFIA